MEPQRAQRGHRGKEAECRWAQGVRLLTSAATRAQRIQCVILNSRAHLFRVQFASVKRLMRVLLGFAPARTQLQYRHESDEPAPPNHIDLAVKCTFLKRGLIYPILA